MDLVASCRVFVHVGERGSFTLGAAAARVPQSVASRRIAALEEHFGERLFDRSARRAALTPFGRDMLPPAKRLVQLAEEMEYHAERARLRPLSLAVPATCPIRPLALLDAAVRDTGIVLDIRAAGPGERADLLRAGQVQVALLAVPPDGADWTVPLGAATTSAPTSPTATAPTATAPTATSPTATARAPGTAKPLRVEDLRPARGRPPRRIILQPEDDVPHIGDALRWQGHRAALLPAQVTVAASLIAAASEAMRAGDFLLCSAAQAAELGLSWRPLAGPPLAGPPLAGSSAGQPTARGYRVAALNGADAERVRASLAPHVARVLGVPEAGGAAR